MMRDCHVSHYAGVVSDVRACVMNRVAIEHFIVKTTPWNADSIFSNYRRKVATDDQEVVWILGLTNVSQNAVVCVHTIDPFKSFGLEVNFV